MIDPNTSDWAMALEQARCPHPFQYLGPHTVGDKTVLHAWLPDAARADVLEVGTGKPLGTLQRLTPTGLFRLDWRQASDTVYQFQIHYPGSELPIVMTDPYQFREAAFHAVHFVDTDPANIYRQLGAQQVTLSVRGHRISGVRFAVFAPNASAVSVVGSFNHWDGRRHPMEKTQCGHWVLFVPDLGPGVQYKFELKDPQGHGLPHKADPVGFFAEQYPSHASVVYDLDRYQWQDSDWQEAQTRVNRYRSPMSIYEVHLGSWKRRPDDHNRWLTYRELADELIPYVKEMGFTHIELMPITEFPFDGSWGYQPVGLFSPTSRFGTPDDFRTFVDACHQQGIGVIMDWVPAHFPNDGHGLARFDGTHVYEYEDPRRGWHPDWNSCIYDFGKDTVRRFLLASALFWLDRYHIDGLRVDAVASMLYLDYSRKAGEWVPNVDGGNINYEAVSFLRWLNEEVYRRFPHAMTIAEESTSFPKVSRPVFEGGLGFGFKWNMGWMHDSLAYMARDPAWRRYHHGEMTFSMIYAWDENFVLPLSHDEVVHGKGALLEKMPGDDWQKAANLRTYIAFMFSHPGKKLNFMGNEIAQSQEWNHDRSLDWHLLSEPKHAGVQRLFRDLNRLYVQYPALHVLDHEPSGFRWLDHENAEHSLLTFLRRPDGEGRTVYICCNFTPVPRDNYRLGIEADGPVELLLNTDDPVYFGSGYPVALRPNPEPVPWQGCKQSILLNIPPLATVYLIQRDMTF